MQVGSRAVEHDGTGAEDEGPGVDGSSSLGDGGELGDALGGEMRPKKLVIFLGILDPDLESAGRFDIVSKI